MMRKIFGGTMMLSIVGAIVLGGVFAWSGSKTSTEQSFHLGSVNWALHYESETGAVGPNDGATVNILGNGWFDNNGDFPLKINGGSVVIDDSNGAPLQCASPAYYSSTVTPLNPGGWLAPHTAGANPNISHDAGLTASQYQATTIVSSSLPDSCLGNNISYMVTLNVTTNS